MIWFKNRVYILGALFGILLLGIVVMPASASSVPDPSVLVSMTWNQKDGWANWAVVVDFVGGRPNGKMQIQIGYTDAFGVDQVVYDHWYEMPCYEVGHVVYHSHNIATFDGQTGYIHCEMYDLIDTVDAITSGGLQLAPVSLHSDVITKVQAAPSNKPKKQNPLFYTDSGISYALPNVNSNDFAQMRLDFELSGQTIVSDLFKVSGMDVHRANVIDPNIITGLTEFENSNLSQTVKQPITMMLSADTSLLTIGADPTTGEYFEGDIEYVFIDPRFYPGCC